MSTRMVPATSSMSSGSSITRSEGSVLLNRKRRWLDGWMVSWSEANKLTNQPTNKPSIQLSIHLTFLLCLAASAQAATLTLNGSQKFQTMDGMGANINSLSWKNGES